MYYLYANSKLNAKRRLLTAKPFVPHGQTTTDVGLPNQLTVFKLYKYIGALSATAAGAVSDCHRTVYDTSCADEAGRRG